MLTVVRVIEPDDYPLLEEFLYQAVFVPEGAPPFPRSIVSKPEISIYIDGFGSKSDFGFVAEQGTQVIGIAWARTIQAFGFVDDDTPELALSVLPGYRGQGIGTQLLTRLLGILNERGYERVSLSVQKENPAVKLYQRLGFRTVRETQDDYIMLKEFPPELMADFFDARAGIYDHHMNVDMELEEFYEAVADLLACPRQDFRLLDLGCGTGLELERLFARYPDMRITGIDLSQAMLDKLREKFSDKPMKLICGSYLDLDLGSGFDRVLSTYSLHHFDANVKRKLYERIGKALVPGGVFLLGDFSAVSQEQQDSAANAAARTRRDNLLTDDECYHLDIPLTVENEMALMKDAGFSTVEPARQWDKASIILAKR